MNTHLIGSLLKPGFLRGLSWGPYLFIYLFIYFIYLFIFFFFFFFFLKCINYIVKNIGCSIRLFADDKNLYIIVESAETAANLINTDLDTISTWAANWLVNFHE